MRGLGGDTAYLALGPKCKTRLLFYFDTLRDQGLTLDRDTLSIHIFGTTAHGMLGAVSLLDPLKGWSRWLLGIFPFKVVST